MIYLDQLQRTLVLKETPKRIISLVPSQTELLVDLGLINFIVGVTKFCVHPSELRKEKTIVGGTKQIKKEKIVELKPDIILCNKEENTKEIIKDLEHIAPIHISDVRTLGDSFELIKLYGQLFTVSKNADAIVNAIKVKRKLFKQTLHNDANKKVAYFIWKNPWMVAASNTFITEMLNEAGYINIFKDETRYPEITLQHPKLKLADKIFLSSEPFPFKSNHVQELASLFPNQSIQMVDGEMFSWHGSRLQKSYRYFESLKP